MAYMYHQDGNPKCKCRICERARDQYRNKKGYEVPIYLPINARDLELRFGVEHPSELGYIEPAKRIEPLEVRVTKDIEALTASLADFESPKPELPSAPKDLTRYVDAYEEAVKTCPHINVNMIIYNQEYSCSDCGKYMNKQTLLQDRRRNDNGNPAFGFFFGSE